MFCEIKNILFGIKKIIPAMMIARTGETVFASVLVIVLLVAAVVLIILRRKQKK